MSVLQRYKELRVCLRSLPSFTDGQARIIDWDEEELSNVRLRLSPNEGMYYGGDFLFQIDLPSEYPEHRPSVTCLSQIYHPNIDTTGSEDNVCLNLFDEWQANFGLVDVVQGLLFLLYNPNPDDALSPLFEGTEEEDSLEEKIALTMKGEVITNENSVDFDPNESCTAWTEQCDDRPLPDCENSLDDLLATTEQRLSKLEEIAEQEAERTKESGTTTDLETGEDRASSSSSPDQDVEDVLDEAIGHIITRQSSKVALTIYTDDNDNENIEQNDAYVDYTLNYPRHKRLLQDYMLASPEVDYILTCVGAIGVMLIQDMGKM